MKSFQGRVIKYTVILEYQGVTYKWNAKANFLHLNFTKEDGDKKLLLTALLNDHGDCDCSRSALISEKVDSRFLQMPCGHEIKLISIEFLD